MYYNIQYNESQSILEIGFGVEATNEKIVVDAHQQMEALVASGQLSGGRLLRINGRASVPVAFTIAHGVAHLFGAVAVFDPKLGKYVVAISHDPAYPVGQLVA